jgi:hypothetical protein
MMHKQHRSYQIHYFDKGYQANVKKSRYIMAIIANLAFPSALIILFPMHSARKGTASIIGAKKLSCRFNNCSFSSKEGASLYKKF